MVGRIRYVPDVAFFLLPLWASWLPLPVILGQWYAVNTTFIPLADDNGLSLTCEIIYCDALFSENGHVAIVSCSAHTH